MKTIEIKNLQAPEIEELSDREAEAVVGGASGSIALAIPVASGSSIDSAYDSEAVKISFALELRDTGR